MTTAENLRLLLIEDSPDDADLIVRELRRSGFTPQPRRVESIAEIAQALNDADWDAVIADFLLPGFTGLDALRLVHESSFDGPFIIVSGTITDTEAVSAMRGGAHDYVWKNHLARLGPAVSRELREARLRSERRRVEQQMGVVLKGVSEAVFAEDSTGHVTYANEPAAANWAITHTAQELIGWSHEELCSNFVFRDESGNPISGDETPMAVARMTGHAVEQTVWRRDMRSGDERWLQATATPIFDERRLEPITIAIFRDVTEQHRAVSDARFISGATQLLNGTLEDFPQTLRTLALLCVPILGDWCSVEIVQPAWPARAESAVAAANPEMQELARTLEQRDLASEHSLFGTPTALATGKAAIIQSPEPTALCGLTSNSAITVPLESQGRAVGAINLLMTDPDRRHTVADLHLAEDLAERASIALENARLYRQSREAVALRDEFVAVASHELRTPVTTLQLMLQRMKKADIPLDRRAGEVERGLRQTSRLVKLVDRLLDVSLAATGRLPIECESVDVSQLVREVVDRTSQDARAAGCTVHLAVPDTLTGEWDRLRLDEVIQNLLSNAYKYGAGKPIDLRVEGTPSSIRILVTDRGIGIRPEDKQRIFKRFERAASARHYGGLGLGLFIVRQIVEAHGGTVVVESEAGKGSTFFVELPRTPGVCPPEELQNHIDVPSINP